MLQQTRIETVLPYFERFIAELPDVAALANVDEARLLKLWEGLGYYNRVRNLQKAARVLVEQYSMSLPASYDQLKKLPGIGDYTAGAIASIAFNLPVPAVDGNVLRVLSRILGSRADISQPGVKSALRGAMTEMLSQTRPGDFNQAMMDLGATVCVPGGVPHCSQCPASGCCEGFITGCAQELPVKAQKKPRKKQQKTVLVLHANNRAMIVQRPQTGLLPSLWEFPNVDGFLSEDEIHSLLLTFGMQPVSVQRLNDTLHVFTHIEWQLCGYLIECKEQTAFPNGIWASAEALKKVHALPSAFASYLKTLYKVLRP
jgi:A/G-specific adenine glycosylase